ncbi:MAG: hypothetical protein PHR35_15115, partial [Kiritimatiellae bacterium]|nr:hypothetical protein [Kiritimatiellia bacterium]
PGGRYFLSLYTRGAGMGTNGAAIRLEVVDATNTVLGSADVAVNSDWRRVELPFEAGAFVRDFKQQTLRDVRLRFLGLRAGQTFLIDAVMLELAGGFSYAGMGQASSWIPGDAVRASESLNVDGLRHLMAGGAGSAAFWVQTIGARQTRRTLFEIAGGNRWQPFLQLQLQQSRLELGPWTNATGAAVAAADIRPGAWHHYAVTWANGSATMYLDGRKLGAIDNLKPFAAGAPSFRLGSLGPGTPANAVVDEAVVFARRLEEGEIAALAARTEALGRELAPSVTVRPEAFVATLAHGTEAQPWRCTVFNHGTDSLRGLEAVLRIGDRLTVRQKLGRLKPGQSADVTFWFLADLALGSYPLRVTVARGRETLATFAREVEITPAPEPFENLQVTPWGFNTERRYGMTCGGGDIEDAMRRGLHAWPLLNFLGYPRRLSGEDHIVDMLGRPANARLDSPYIRAQIDREGARTARRLAGLPALRGVTLNSEMQWIWTHDFTPEHVAWVQATFGIDLNRWRNPPKGEEHRYQAPFGRLIPGAGGIALPSNRIVRVNEPFYAYHRWFLGPRAPTESYLNQTLGTAIQARRPDILTVQEPILRRPSVRAFDQMSLAQDWFYYENPMAAVSVQECLHAAVRGTTMRFTGMPQFLFKAGTTAPYNAMPTADMFRETAWLCALQPIRMMTYWNFSAVPDPAYSDAYNRLYRKEQLDEIFGSATPTWKQVQDVLAARPELAKLMPWTPELIAAFTRFHVETIGPLGGLVPEWRNRPRRLAIIRSFANELYGSVRWPTFSRLENGAVYSGIPFDVLFDEDFETGRDVLETYDLVIVSGAVCLTEPVHAALCRHIRRGRAVVTDSGTTVEIPGALTIMPAEKSVDYASALAAREAELRKRSLAVHDPAYVEAVSQQADAGAWPNQTDPALMRVLEQHVRPEARSLTANTWMNLLTAEGANYVGVVNDLRVFGPMYGHFGKVREQGVPLTATVVCQPALGAFAYDLAASRAVPMTPTNGLNALRLALPPGGGRLVMLTSRPIGRLEGLARIEAVRWGGHRGREIRLDVALRDADGGRMEGLVPVTVELLAPDGTVSDFSRHGVIRDGRLALRFPVLSNGPTGTWRCRIRERASGQTTEPSVQIGS